jgi:hypothetical protein
MSGWWPWTFRCSLELITWTQERFDGLAPANSPLSHDINRPRQRSGASSRSGSPGAS